MTSDVEFNGIQSLVLGRVYGQYDINKNPHEAFQSVEHALVSEMLQYVSAEIVVMADIDGLSHWTKPGS